MIFAGGVNYFIVNINDGDTRIFFSKDGGKYKYKLNINSIY